VHVRPDQPNEINELADIWTFAPGSRTPQILQHGDRLNVAESATRLHQDAERREPHPPAATYEEGNTSSSQTGEWEAAMIPFIPSIVSGVLITAVLVKIVASIVPTV
jgi:hypothetical protein